MLNAILTSMIVELDTHKVIHVCRGGGRLSSIELERGRLLLLKLKSKTRKNLLFALPMKNTILSFIQIMYFFLSFLSYTENVTHDNNYSIEFIRH